VYYGIAPEKRTTMKNQRLNEDMKSFPTVADKLRLITIEGKATGKKELVRCLHHSEKFLGRTSQQKDIVC
jgi:hypothetical protein